VPRRIVVQFVTACLWIGGCSSDPMPDPTADQRMEDAKAKIAEQLKVGHQEHMKNQFRDVRPGGLGPAGGPPAPSSGAP
jgi:hypothetical protein